jgi:hypothetical protein
MHFHALKTAVATQFAAMQKYEMFRVAVEKDELWDTYLNSFPTGSNPHYRERTSHDCSCCKQFIRAVGDVVAIIDNKVVSLWDIVVKNEPEYQAVVDAMSKLIKNAAVKNEAGELTGAIEPRAIADYFLHEERTAGTDKNFEQLTDGVKTWEHFFVNIPAAYHVPKNSTPSRESRLGDLRAHRDVFARGLAELAPDAVSAVQDLVNSNSLYKGAEKKPLLDQFAKLQKEYLKLDADGKRLFAWQKTKGLHGALAKFRNDVIGTLVEDLTDGVDLEVAVAKFEDKVHGSKYKRPTALVTKSMIANAKAKLEELGLTSALRRRYANVNDITVNNLIYVNRATRKIIEGDVFDDLMSGMGDKLNSRKLDKVEEVSIENFIANIVPTASNIEIMLDNNLSNNLVSLIAPEDPTAGNLFKWNNNFSWSYTGEVTDSIIERVKKAGGNVTGDLCCRLAWYNHDDLDFHMIEPNGYEIYFGTRTSKSPNGGRLDVDMNAGTGTTREPVENIFYESRKTMKEGVYTLLVNQFSKRETKDVGFEVEIDFMGTRYNFAFPQAVANKAKIEVAKFEYTHKDGLKIISSLPMTQASKTIWGLPTQTFHKVNAMMLSPNFWDDNEVGNKHYFFMLEGCVNDDSARGFYNEFLKQELNEHRKVFEVVGAKMTVDDATAQLSGIGVSSTLKKTVIARVSGNVTRTVKIVF